MNTMKTTFVLIVLIFLATNISAQNVSLYTVATVGDTVKSSGILPQGSWARFTNEGGDNRQISKGKKVQFQAFGYDGMQIEKIVMTMKSGASSGRGGLYIYVNDKEVLRVANNTLFSDAQWNGSYSTIYVPIEKDISDVVVDSGGKINVNIVGGAFDNDLYVESYAIEYSNTNVLQLETPNNVSVSELTSISAKVSWDSVDNASLYEVKVANGSVVILKDTVSTNELILTGLNESTSYEVSVKAVSQDPNYSDSEESGLLSFTTSVGDKYTITFEAGGGVVSEASLQETTHQGGICLPVAQAELGLLYEFVGWTKVPIKEVSEDEPASVLKGGERYFPQENESLYALYKSKDLIETEEAVESTSITEQNESWHFTGTIVGASTCYYVESTDTIVTPEFNRDYVKTISINMRRFIGAGMRSIKVYNEGRKLGELATLTEGYVVYELEVNKEISGKIEFVPWNLTTNAIGISSIDIDIESPKYLYCFDEKEFLERPNVVAETTSSSVELFWSAVDGAESYEVRNCGQVVANVSRNIHKYTIANLNPNENYKFSVVAQPKEEADKHYSVTENYYFTEDISRELLEAEDGASIDYPTHKLLSNTQGEIITIGENVRLVADEDRVLKRVTLEKGSVLEVSSGITLKVDRVEMHTENDEVSELYIDGVLHANLGIQFIKTISDNSKYYFFSLPFTCPIDNVWKTNGEAIGELSKDWSVAWYDEHKRATRYKEISAGKDSAWVDLAIGDTIYKNQGYIIATAEPMTLEFPQVYEIGKDIVDGNKVSTVYTDVVDKTSGALSQTGWNLVTLPFYRSNYNDINFSGSIDNIQDIPVSISDEKGIDYIQGLSSDMEIRPFQSYFVQVPEEGILTFEQTKQSLPQDNNGTKTEISLLKGLDELDKATIKYYANPPKEYWLGRELEKLSSYTVNSEIYIIKNRLNLAIAAFERDRIDTVELGIYISEIGTYTLSTNDLNIGILDTQNNIMSKGTMSFTATQEGFINDRFKLIVNSIPAEENIESESRYLIYSEKEGIIIEGLKGSEIVALYTTAGQLIKEDDVKSTSYEFIDLVNGVYLLKIKRNSSTEIIKVII